MKSHELCDNAHPLKCASWFLLQLVALVDSSCILQLLWGEQKLLIRLHNIALVANLCATTMILIPKR